MKTETVLIIGAAALIFGAPLLKALAGNGNGPQPTRAVLDPSGGPTRVLAPNAVPTPTPSPVIAGDVVTNEFIPHGPDVSVISVGEVGKQTGKFLFDFAGFAVNPIGSTINQVISIF